MTARDLTKMTLKDLMEVGSIFLLAHFSHHQDEKIPDNHNEIACDLLSRLERDPSAHRFKSRAHQLESIEMARCRFGLDRAGPARSLKEVGEIFGVEAHHARNRILVVIRHAEKLWRHRHLFK